MATLTDRLKIRIDRELELRRGTLDEDRSLNRLTIIVQIDSRTAQIKELSWRPEHHSGADQK